MPIKFGCHTSTWVLDYDKEVDIIDHIIDVVSEAGFEGIDIQVALLGRYKEDPVGLRRKLESKGIELASLTVPFTWLDNTESEEERERADYFIRYVKNFPNALLNLPSRVGPNRENLLRRQREIINCANAVGKRAYEEGVVTAFHPASPETSYFRTESDYKILFQELDTRYIGYTPDAGHIATGRMNAVDVVRENIPIIKHVHIKDCSKNCTWTKMGEGDIDFPSLVKTLVMANYEGWIMVEEESPETALDPDKAVHDIQDYVSSKLKPLLIIEK